MYTLVFQSICIFGVRCQLFRESKMAYSQYVYNADNIFFSYYFFLAMQVNDKAAELNNILNTYFCIVCFKKKKVSILLHVLGTNETCQLNKSPLVIQNIVSKHDCLQYT